MIVLGIDPGLKGGIAVLQPGRTPRVGAMPSLRPKKGGRETYDFAEIASLLRWFVSGGGVTAVLERLAPMPPFLARGGGALAGAGGSIANYHRGLGRGLFEGILTALGIPYHLVGPREWQDEMLPLRGGDTKARSIARARELFPDVSLYPTARSRKPSDGLSDALLIAEFGRRRLDGGEATNPAWRRA